MLIWSNHPQVQEFQEIHAHAGSKVKPETEEIDEEIMMTQQSDTQTNLMCPITKVCVINNTSFFIIW